VWRRDLGVPVGQGWCIAAVTLRVYSHVLREHTRRVGDIFAQAIGQAIKAPVANPLANGSAASERLSVFAGESGGQGGVEPPTFR
jgi:hypothetical protein